MASTPDISQLSDAQLASLLAQSEGSADGKVPAVMGPVQAIKQIESSGASDSAKVVNPASSAAGSMQVLSGTRRDPGYGVKPSNGTAEDDARVGRDYFKALQTKYGNDPQAAALAYSWGPGNVDKWTKAGSDLSKLPDEQLNYLLKFQKLTGLGTGDSEQPVSARAALAAQAPGKVKTTTNPVMMGVRDALYSTLDSATGWISKAANAIAPDSQLARDFEEGRKQLHATNAAQEEAYDSVDHSTGGKIVRGATDLTAKALTSPMVGGGLGTMVVQGAAQGALANPDDMLAGAAMGAGGGAAGHVVGKAVGAAAKPVVKALQGTKQATAAADSTAAKAGTATGGDFTTNELRMANKLADDVNSASTVTGQGARDVAAELRANGKSAVPGYQRTAAEATNNPTIQAVQQGLDKSESNAALAARASANAEANSNFLRAAATTDAQLAAQREAFEKAQQALAEQGNREMPAISSADDRGLFNTPAMQRAVGRANIAAQNDGSKVIQNALDEPNSAMVNAWNRVAGSEGKTAKIETQRTLTTSPMYTKALDAAKPFAVDHNLASIINTPAMRSALKQVETYKANSGDLSPVIQDLAAVGRNGDTFAQSVSAQDLNLAKMVLDDHIQNMGNPSHIASADKFHRSAYIDIRNKLNKMLEDNVQGFKEANVEYARHSSQMAESKFLTNQNMVDATGRLNVRQLDTMVKNIEAGRANNNPHDPAKAVSAAKLAQLRQMRDDAVAMMNRNSAKGLQGEAFNYLREGATKDPAAAQALQQHLEKNSPAYKQFYQSQVAGEQAIQHQQNYNDLTKRFDSRADGNVTWNDVKHLGTTHEDFSPENVARLNAVFENLQRYGNRTEKVAGSDTASNIAKREGFEKFIEGERKGGIGNALMSEKGERLMRTVVSGLGIGHAATTLGPLAGIAADFSMDKLGTKAAHTLGRVLGGESEAAIASKTAANRDAIEKLLLHPERLADAIAAAEKAGATKKEIQESLISKVKGIKDRGGLLGAIVGAQLAAHSGDREGK